MNEVNPLAAYALEGLRRCWMPSHGRWSHKYHLDGRPQPNESLPHSDIYYSLNVLLGLAQVRPALARQSLDVASIYGDLCSQALAAPMRNGAWGMALWAATALDLDVPGTVLDRLRPLTADISIAASWTAQDVGLTLSGVSALAARDPAWRPLAQALHALLSTRFATRGVLFRDGATGPRRHFATFATQVYAALALYHYGEFVAHEAAIAAANACAAKLIALQGPLGEWPWFYLPGADRVLDPYEIYSVHQHGMAPAVLHHAVQHGVPGAREAIIKGFNWIFGANEMGVSMMVPPLQLIYRSQRRVGAQGRRDMRLLRAARIAVLGGSGWPAEKPALELTPEMRSYEFGWILWSFGGRSDYPELTRRPEFAINPD